MGGQRPGRCGRHRAARPLRSCLAGTHSLDAPELCNRILNLKIVKRYRGIDFLRRAIDECENRHRENGRRPEWLGLMLALTAVLMTSAVFCDAARAEFQYVHKVQGSKQLVIFVHGLWGDPKKSFEPSNYLGVKTGRSWMELMRTDNTTVRGQPSLSEYSTATLGYPANYSGSLSTHQAAKNLLTELFDTGLLHDKDMRVYFIAHSLGGLVVKAMMLSGDRKKRTLLAARTQAVIFLATPKRGAPLADIALKLLPQVITGRIILDLKTENTYLGELQDQWAVYTKQTARKKRFAVFCAFETEDVIGIPNVIGIRPVPRLYAYTDCDELAWPANGEDHLSIAKPTEIRTSNIYGWVRGRLNDVSASSRSKDRAVPQVPERGRLAAAQRALDDEQTNRATEPLNKSQFFAVTPALIREAQQRLFELNYDVGDIDGMLGQRTRRAILSFEADAKLTRNKGELTATTLKALRTAKSLAPWGAIVYARTANRWGASWQHKTRREAIAAAMRSCGQSSCRERFSFFREDCAAFAHSSSHRIIVADDTVGKATSAALVQCRKTSKECSIVAAFCADGKGAPDND